MTIIIGIKCTSGITVACDSRTTEPTGHVKDNVQKLNVIHFADGNSVIMGEAGNAQFSAQAVEIISQAARLQKLSGYRSVADCVEKSVSELKQKMRDQYKGTSEELQKHFDAYGFELMIAYYWEGQPYIFTLDFVSGFAIKQNDLYCAIGCGKILADFLISRLDVSQFSTGTAMWTSVYAIEEIKKFDSRCGGQTRSAIVKNQNGLSVANISADVPMQEAVKEALAFSEEAKANWKSTASQRIQQLVSKRNPIT